MKRSTRREEKAGERETKEEGEGEKSSADSLHAAVGYTKQRAVSKELVQIGTTVCLRHSDKKSQKSVETKEY